MIRALFVIFLLSLFVGGCCKDRQVEQTAGKENTFPLLEGDYLGQEPPGDTPQLFAPGIMSTGFHEHSFPAFSPDGNEVYWSAWVRPFSKEVILYMKREGNRWTAPEVAPFSGKYIDGGPCFSPDGQKLFFASKRPQQSGGKPFEKRHLWCLQRRGDGWSAPQCILHTVGFMEVRPSVTTGGTIYFMADYKDSLGEYDIYRMKWENGSYTKPENLGEAVNSKYKEFSSFIAVDESFLIFSRYDHPEGDGLYISFRREDGTWTKARNMGKEINTTPRQRFPAISPDGQYLFFTSNRLADRFKEDVSTSYTYKLIKERQVSPENGFDDIYWMKPDIIQRLKKEILK